MSDNRRPILTDDERKISGNILAWVSTSDLPPKQKDMLSQWYVAWIKDKLQDVDDGK